MRTQFRFATAALVAGLIGLQPTFAQQPEAELKKAQEQLEKLLKELKEKEAKKAEAPKPVPPTPTARPAAAWTQLHNPNDANAALKGLAASKDPKVAAMAKELLDHLNKTAPQGGKPTELRVEFANPVAGGADYFEFKVAPADAPKSGAGANTFEFKAAHPPPDAPKPGAGASTFEFKAAQPELFKVLPGNPGEKVERRIVVVGDGTHAKPVEARVVLGEKITATVAGPSTLKLSADGKTAALLSADGTITIFDVATGKEMMKFASKK